MKEVIIVNVVALVLFIGPWIYFEYDYRKFKKFINENRWYK